MLVTTRSLDHHGIVSGTYDELEIGKVIDEVLPKLGQHKLAHSIVVKAMILNCLGFTDSRLYMLSLIHISEPTRRTPISYAVFCLKKKKKKKQRKKTTKGT